MADVEITVEVAADPERVWDVLVDPDRLGEWLTVHQGFETPPPPVRAGAEIEQRLGNGALEAVVEWIVEEAERPAGMVWHGRGPGGSQVRTSYRLRACETGTRITCASDVELPGGILGGLASGAAVPQGRREAQRSLERLRDLVEGG